MLNEKEFDHSMKIKTISKNEAKKRLGEIEGYESLIEDEKSINILSETLEINIKSSKGQKEFTPFDTLIVAQNSEVKNNAETNKDSLKFMMLELNALWKVDYYSRDRELLHEITLGNISYSEAKKEAFLAGIRIPYDIYDIYFIK
jgi:hypothetical protein